MSTFVFVLFLTVFGGPVEIRFTHTTFEGCAKMHRVVKLQLNSLMMRHALSDCAEVRP